MSTGTGLSRAAVPAAFDVGASAYDRLVGANPGYHAHLRLSARRMRLPGDGRGLRLLDAGCGTGASTAALLSAAPRAEIVAIDASGQMLAQARAKSWPPSVRFVHARVEDLAGAGVHGPFDGILAAYLIRNLADPDGQLRALRDLLRPGGTLAVHEYSVRDSARARLMWNAVSLERHHPVRPGGHRGRHPVPLSVPQRGGLRRGAAVPPPAAGGGLHRGAQRDDDRLAARRRAHLPGHPGALDDHGGRARPAGGTAPRPGRRAGRGPAAARPHAIVVGAGIAGLAAAAGLAERGVRVTVAEREPYLGGRVGGWTRIGGLPPTARPGGPADEPRVPRLLPPVLQPAGAAAPRRPGAAAARPADRLPAGRRRRPPGQFPRSAPHPAVERDRVRAAQPHLPAPGPARAERRGGGPAGGRERAGHLRTARRHRRRDVPAGHQLPGRRPAPGLRGVLAQLLRPARRDVRGRAGLHVPHLFSRLQRGPGVRRARRRFRRRAVGAAARLPDGAWA